MPDMMVAIVAAGLGGILTKVIWDILRAPSKFVTLTVCKDKRGNCKAIAELRRDFVEHKAHVDERLNLMQDSVNRFLNKMEDMTEGMQMIRMELTVLNTYIRIKNGDAHGLDSDQIFQKK